jgi:putative transcription factor
MPPFVNNFQQFEHVVLKKYSKPESKQNTNTNVSSNNLSVKRVEEDTENLSHQKVSCSKQIIAARCAKGWNQAKLAQVMNVNKKLVEEYENGKALPKDNELQQFRRVLGCKLTK